MSATVQKSLRIPSRTATEIERIARESGREFSAVANELFEEALRMHRCPGIVFAEGTTGRRARVAGTALAPGFVEPRGLAYARYNGRRYLYALTSRGSIYGVSDRDSRLWRIDLSGSTPTIAWIDLTVAAFGIENHEVFGLAYDGGRVFISYDMFICNYQSIR